MKKNIKELILGIAADNKQYIIEGHYTSVADYVITTSDSADNWYWAFEDSEYDNPSGMPSDEQIDEVKEYLKDNFNYLPECSVEDMIQTAEYEFSHKTYGTIEIVKEVPLSEDATLYIWRGNYDTDYPTETACIVNGGEFFSLTDWQGAYPQTAKEVEDYKWVNIEWRPAIVLNGIPRMLI